MNRSRTIGVAASVLVIALSPSVALAGQQPGLKGDKPPAAGHWTVKAYPSGNSKTAGGSFVVTKSHRVKKMRVTVKHVDVAECGAPRFRVSGAKQLHKIYNGNGEDEWVIGKYEAGASPSYTAIKTKVIGHGKTFNATIAMSFNARPDTDTTRTFGYITVKGTPGGVCYLDFSFKKG